MPSSRRSSQASPKKREASESESDFEPSGNSPGKSTGSKSGSRKRNSDDAEEHDPPPTVKKPRLGKDPMSHVLRSSSGDSYFEIGKKKRVTVRVFKDHPLVDIREYYGADGEEKPGKKGISLSVEQWEAIKSNVATIEELLSNLKK